jgi:hypothetical protein
MEHLAYEDREALRQEIFRSLHCALPGTVLSFDAETQTAEIQPAVKMGSMLYPPLKDVPVFMPVPFEVHPGDACLVVFADIDVDAWLHSGEPEEPLSSRRHALSDGFALIGWRVGPQEVTA